MARSILRLLIIGMLFSGLLMACRTVPVYNVESAPLAPPPRASLADITRAIERAGGGLGWEMSPVAPGHIIGTLNIRSHTAVVDITYTRATYSIHYNRSHNLEFDGANIHSNYNGWIQNLQRAIQTEVATL